MSADTKLCGKCFLQGATSAKQYDLDWRPLLHSVKIPREGKSAGIGSHGKDSVVRGPREFVRRNGKGLRCCLEGGRLTKRMGSGGHENHLMLRLEGQSASRKKRKNGSSAKERKRRIGRRKEIRNFTEETQEKSKFSRREGKRHYGCKIKKREGDQTSSLRQKRPPGPKECNIQKKGVRQERERGTSHRENKKSGLIESVQREKKNKEEFVKQERIGVKKV